MSKSHASKTYFLSHKPGRVRQSVARPIREPEVPYSIPDPAICDRLWDFGPYGGTWVKFGF